MNCKLVTLSLQGSLKVKTIGYAVVDLQPGLGLTWTWLGLQSN